MMEEPRQPPTQKSPTAEEPKWMRTRTRDGVTRKYIVIPDTMARWPWPPTMHPAYDESVSKESYKWLEDYGALTPKTQKAFNKGKIDLLTAMAYIDGPRELLRLQIDILHAFFLVECYTDNLPAPVVQKTVDYLIDASVHPDKPRPEGEPPMGEICREVFQRSRELGQPLGVKHWTNAWVVYLEAMVQEAEERDSNHKYAIDEYIVKRRLYIGAIPAYAAGSLHKSIPHDVWNHPHVDMLRNLSSDLIMVDNDIASWNKEQASGADRCNILHIVMDQLGVDFDGAMNWAVRLHDKLLDDFIKGMAELPSFGAEVDAELRVYVEHLRHWPYAMIKWNYTSGRYFGTTYDPETRTIPLLPKIKRSVQLGGDVDMVDVDELLKTGANKAAESEGQPVLDTHTQGTGGSERPGSLPRSYRSSVQSSVSRAWKYFLSMLRRTIKRSAPQQHEQV